MEIQPVGSSDFGSTTSRGGYAGSDRRRSSGGIGGESLTTPLARKGTMQRATFTPEPMSISTPQNRIMSPGAAIPRGGPRLSASLASTSTAAYPKMGVESVGELFGSPEARKQSLGGAARLARVTESTKRRVNSTAGPDDVASALRRRRDDLGNGDDDDSSGSEASPLPLGIARGLRTGKGAMTGLAAAAVDEARMPVHSMRFQKAVVKKMPRMFRKYDTHTIVLQVFVDLHLLPVPALNVKPRPGSSASGGVLGTPQVKSVSTESLHAGAGLRRRLQQQIGAAQDDGEVPRFDFTIHALDSLPGSLPGSPRPGSATSTVGGKDRNGTPSRTVSIAGESRPPTAGGKSSGRSTAAGEATEEAPTEPKSRVPRGPYCIRVQTQSDLQEATAQVVVALRRIQQQERADLAAKQQRVLESPTSPGKANKSKSASPFAPKHDPYASPVQQDRPPKKLPTTKGKQKGPALKEVLSQTDKSQLEADEKGVMLHDSALASEVDIPADGVTLRPCDGLGRVIRYQDGLFSVEEPLLEQLSAIAEPTLAVCLAPDPNVFRNAVRKANVEEWEQEKATKAAMMAKREANIKATEARRYDEEVEAVSRSYTRDTDLRRAMRVPQASKEVQQWRRDALKQQKRLLSEQAAERERKEEAIRAEAIRQAVKAEIRMMLDVEEEIDEALEGMKAAEEKAWTAIMNAETRSRDHIRHTANAAKRMRSVRAEVDALAIGGAAEREQASRLLL